MSSYVFFFNAFDFWSWIAGYYYLLRSKIKCISNLSRFSRWLLGFYFEAGSKFPKYPMLVDAQSPAFQTQLPRHSDWQVKAFLESRKGESVAKAEIKSGSAWKQWPEVNLSASLFLSKDFHSSLKVSSLHFAIIVVEIFTFIATASDF